MERFRTRTRGRRESLLLPALRDYAFFGVLTTITPTHLQLQVDGAKRNPVAPRVDVTITPALEGSQICATFRLPRERLPSLGSCPTAITAASWVRGSAAFCLLGFPLFGVVLAVWNALAESWRTGLL